MVGHVLVRGRSISLREMDESDAPHVVTWRNRPEVSRWFNQRGPLTVAAHLEYWHKARKRGDVLLVFSDGADAPVGTGSLYDFDPDRTSAEWGRLCGAGLVTRALEMIEGGYLVHRLAFEVFRLRRTHCATRGTNTAARRYDMFLGYVREGLRRRHVNTREGPDDVIEFGMFPEEFAAARRPIERSLYGESEPPAFTEAARALPAVIAERLTALAA